MVREKDVIFFKDEDGLGARRFPRQQLPKLPVVGVPYPLQATRFNVTF
jgi:hypothetical protein